jgi:hypothetical protein
MWSWITKLVSDLPTSAALKEKYDTKVMLLEAKHASAIHDLEAKSVADNLELHMKIKNLEAENSALHREVTKLTEEGHRLNRVVNIQASQLSTYAELEEERRNSDPPLPGADVGL